MTQKERQERSREEIYQAALEEFGTSGYDKVNMERICGNHGISKGMMYHYYSSKDALFLLCVERTFAELKDYVEQHAELLDGQDTLNDIREYFLIREHFFQQNPREKMIFETAMLRPPKLLAEQIHQLRAPIRSMNREFLRRLVGKMPLCPGLDQEKATRYLESVGYFFQNVASCYYQSGKTGTDLHAVLEQAGEMLDLFLFGVLRQPGCPADPLQPGDGPDPAGSGGAAGKMPQLAPPRCLLPGRGYLAGPGDRVFQPNH